jgi:hypothetical protein
MDCVHVQPADAREDLRAPGDAVPIAVPVALATPAVHESANHVERDTLRVVEHRLAVRPPSTGEALSEVGDDGAVGAGNELVVEIPSLLA